MRSQRQRQHDHERRLRGRALRRKHERLAVVLLAGELDLPSMSGLLIAFAEPLRELLPARHGLAAYEDLLHAAALVWNAARAYEGPRLAEGLEVAERQLVQLSGAEPAIVQGHVLRRVLERRTRYAQEARFIGGVEVLHEGGGEWRVLVAARHLPPLRRADGADEEVRPSSLLDEAGEGGFIV